jgi:hypothetical protein
LYHSTCIATLPHCHSLLCTLSLTATLLHSAAHTITYTLQLALLQTTVILFHAALRSAAHFRNTTHCFTVAQYHTTTHCQLALPHTTDILSPAAPRSAAYFCNATYYLIASIYCTAAHSHTLPHVLPKKRTLPRARTAARMHCHILTGSLPHTVTCTASHTYPLPYKYVFSTSTTTCNRIATTSSNL